MVGWNNTLTVEEISGLITLIKRWEEIPAGTIPAPDVPIPTTEESIALGSQLFTANCARCHGPEGQGTPRAPSLNVKSFLTGTNDQAILQIVTSGVPGTAMPAWGDRMTDAEIQAIVGFIRQWEPTAPEVAVLTRPGGGGPPWRNNTKTQGAGLLPVANNTVLNTIQQGTQSAQILDWRILLLAGVILSIAFTLIATGFSALRKRDGPGA
jgi:mono/diheme cytochrome c family protein